MPETVYKLTTKDGRTRLAQDNETQWGEGVTHTAPGGNLCTAGVIHAYADPLQAVFMDPARGHYGEGAALWDCEAEVCERAPDKLGCTRLTTLERVPLPKITQEQRVEIAIRCALAVRHLWGKCPQWDEWEQSRIEGGRDAADAAHAAYAAFAAAYAAYAADAAHAAFAAAYAAYAAADAADAAADGFDLVGIIHAVVGGVG